MSLSAAEIGAVLAELGPLRGAPVQKIWSPTPRTVVLRLRAPGATHDLLVCAEPGRTRLHRARSRPPGSGAHLQAALRAELLGLRLDELVQDPPGDRIVALRFAGPERARTLVAELLGRRGNLLLLDDRGDVLQLADARSSRGLVPGATYRPPPGTPTVSGSRFEPGDGFAVNEAVEKAYAGADALAELEGARRQVRRPLVRAGRRYRRALEKLRAEEQALGDPDHYRHLGELLKTQLGRVRRGMEQIEVTDWACGRPRIIELQPQLGPRENLERLFKLHRKYRDAPAHIAARTLVVQASLDEVETLLVLLEGTDEPGEIAPIEARARKHVRRQVGGGRHGGPPVRLPYWSFESSTAARILVGRGARDNHALTFSVARGNDVWLHVRGVPGSHVVVPTGGRGECDEQTLLDAAHLAVHYSRAKGEDVVEVGWTLRKHVSHPRGARPGLVTTARLRTLLLRTEPYRLSRLLATRGSG